MNFIGQFPVRLDAKNRAFVPAGFRRSLQDSGCKSLIIRKDYFENCLVVYPDSVWEQELEKVRARLNRFDGSQQMIYRKLVSEAQEVQLDSNGRMLLPKALLQQVGISQDVLFVGMQQTIEIWAQQTAAPDGGQAFMTDEEFARGLMDCMKD